MPEYVSGPGAGTAVEDQSKTAKPRRFKVLLHNDDYTTMEFVVMILESVFHRNRDDAVRIMLSVHRSGIGVAGVYIRSVAETKVRAVQDLAREAGFPLMCSMEPE